MYEKKYKTNVLKQKNTVKKSKWSFLRKIIFFIILILVIFGIDFLLRNPKMQVNNVVILGTSVLDQKDLSESVKNKLSGKFLWFFPKSSVILINDKSIEKTLKGQFSRINTVSAKRVNFNTIEIKVKEFGPAYLWCIETKEDCYFMDNQGIVYSSAPVFSGTAYPKVFTGAPLMNLPFLGIKPEDLSKVSELQEKLSEIDISPVNFRFITPRDLRIDFLHNKKISELRIDPNVNVETSLEYLFSGIRTEPFASSFKNESKELLYIDLRFPNKVVYKFQD